MKPIRTPRAAIVFSLAAMLPGAPALAASSIQVGDSGLSYASSAVQCAANPDTGQQAPVIEVGLFNPKRTSTATVSLNGATVTTVTADSPSTPVWLADGNNTVVVALKKKLADRYSFAVQPDMCALPDTSGNTFSADGTLEYAASGKSYATVTPGCALNPLSGVAQPYVHLFDNGPYLLNVSVNGLPLTQLDGTYKTHTPVFLGAGQNVISAANAYLSVDYYIRDGGDGTCMLP